MSSRPANLLEASGLPLAYPIEPGDASVPAPPPAVGHDAAVRTVVRSLTVMQKEAVVATSTSPIAWRLSSDEGPYLNGHDFAPAPLAVAAAGFTAELMERIQAATGATPAVALDTHYTMEGSMLRGTMVGGANPPEITVAGADLGAVLTAVNASAIAGLAGPSHESLFSLTCHGREIPVGRVAAAEGDALPDPGGGSDPRPADGAAVTEALVSKVRSVDDKSATPGSSLQESQKRSLHVRAEGIWRSDGLKQIDVDLIRPNGSTFRFVSEEPPGRGGEGRAPDALAMISAGLGFCFMTQIGRVAKIAKQGLGDYRIVQDTRFSTGRAAAAVTHVYLAPDGDDDFAREALDMSEQTCFLHAMCRTELRPKVRVVPDAASS